MVSNIRCWVTVEKGYSGYLRGIITWWVLDRLIDFFFFFERNEMLRFGSHEVERKTRGD